MPAENLLYFAKCRPARVNSCLAETARAPRRGGRGRPEPVGRGARARASAASEVGRGDEAVERRRWRRNERGGPGRPSALATRGFGEGRRAARVGVQRRRSLPPYGTKKRDSRSRADELGALRVARRFSRRLALLCTATAQRARPNRVVGRRGRGGGVGWFWRVGMALRSPSQGRRRRSGAPRRPSLTRASLAAPSHPSIVQSHAVSHRCVT